MTDAGRGLLVGRRGLVTAAAGAGIGRAVARRCVEEGAEIAISDIHEGRLAETQAELAAISGTEPPAFVCDATDTAQIERTFDQAAEALGPLDLLVNNAGRGMEKPVVEITDAEWDSMLAINLTSAFAGTRTALRHMMPRGRGAIVNISSVLGWRAQVGQSAYAAAKAGVMALTRCAAMEATPSEVRVNAVAPTLVKHPFLERAVSRELIEELEAKEPFGRGARPDEIADVVVFLLSDLSSYLTGEVISASCQHP